MTDKEKDEMLGALAYAVMCAKRTTPGADGMMPLRIKLHAVDYNTLNEFAAARMLP